MKMFNQKNIQDEAKEKTMDCFNINSGRFIEMLFDSVSDYPKYDFKNMVKILNKYEDTLTKAGFTKDARNNDGDTVLMAVTRRRNNNKNILPIIKDLLELGFDPNANTDDWISPLMMSIINSKEDRALELLKHDIDINLKRKEMHNNPMLVEAMGSLFPKKVVLKLIEKGADVNATNDNGITPLISMAYSLKPFSSGIKETMKDIATALLDKGAKIKTKDNNDRNVFSMAASHKNYTFLKVFNEILKQKEIKIDKEVINNVDNKGNTPLLSAATGLNIREEHSKDIITVLLENGADIHATNLKKQNVIEVAEEEGNKGFLTAYKKIIEEKKQEAINAAIEADPLLKDTQDFNKSIKSLKM